MQEIFYCNTRCNHISKVRPYLHIPTSLSHSLQLIPCSGSLLENHVCCCHPVQGTHILPLKNIDVSSSSPPVKWNSKSYIFLLGICRRSSLVSMCNKLASVSLTTILKLTKYLELLFPVMYVYPR